MKMEGDARPSGTEEDPVHDSDEFRMFFYKVRVAVPTVHLKISSQ